MLQRRGQIETKALHYYFWREYAKTRLNDNNKRITKSFRNSDPLCTTWYFGPYNQFSSNQKQWLALEVFGHSEGFKQATQKDQK
jgi:hypothetical protein